MNKRSVLLGIFYLVFIFRFVLVSWRFGEWFLNTTWWLRVVGPFWETNRNEQVCGDFIEMCGWVQFIANRPRDQWNHDMNNLFREHFIRANAHPLADRVSLLFQLRAVISIRYVVHWSLVLMLRIPYEKIHWGCGFRSTQGTRHVRLLCALHDLCVDVSSGSIVMSFGKILVDTKIPLFCMTKIVHNETPSIETVRLLTMESGVVDDVNILGDNPKMDLAWKRTLLRELDRVMVRLNLKSKSRKWEMAKYRFFILSDTWRLLDLFTKNQQKWNNVFLVQWLPSLVFGLIWGSLRPWLFFSAVLLFLGFLWKIQTVWKRSKKWAPIICLPGDLKPFLHNSARRGDALYETKWELTCPVPYDDQKCISPSWSDFHTDLSLDELHSRIKTIVSHGQLAASTTLAVTGLAPDLFNVLLSYMYDDISTETKEDEVFYKWIYTALNQLPCPNPI